MRALRQFALRLPETEEGVACAGTALETSTVKRNGKAFVFLRATDVRLKLDASLGEASALAERDPTRYSAGANGWVLVKLEPASDDLGLLKRWIEESHALAASSKSRSAKGSGKKSRKPKT
jgi:hypothetical protein